jgi:uncharacterized DUF497 family protein
MLFEWDRYNLAKIAAHGLTAPEVEAVFDDPELEITEQPHPEELRFRAIAHAGSKRIAVIWTPRGDAIRPVTAWPESRPRKRS